MASGGKLALWLVSRYVSLAYQGLRRAPASQAGNTERLTQLEGDCHDTVWTAQPCPLRLAPSERMQLSGKLSTSGHYSPIIRQSHEDPASQTLRDFISQPGMVCLLAGFSP